MSQSGFFNLFSIFPLPKSSYFISWVVALFYSLTVEVCNGSVNKFIFGHVFNLLGIRIANKVWNEKNSIKVGWILALYPTLVLYSSLILREAYVWFFLTIGIYGVVSWFKDGYLKSVIIIIIGFIGATFFHGGMFVGGFVFLCIVVITSFFESIKKLKHFKIATSSHYFKCFIDYHYLFTVDIRFNSKNWFNITTL